MKIKSFCAIITLLLLFVRANNCQNKSEDSQTQISSNKTAGIEKNSNETITIDLPGLPEGATKLDMVLIKPGSFIMGFSEEASERHKFEWPSHKVTISKPFYIGKYEITQAQWEAVLGENSHHSKYRPLTNNPVEKVSWIHCQLFIRKLNKLGQGTFRLPTEAEWEYACRAGTDTQYFFGGSLQNADNYMWWSGNNNPKGTKAAGLKQPNPWGLYDMLGNVSEWCSDSFDKPYNRSDFTDSQSAPSILSYLLLLKNRVSRGGAFGSSAGECRSSSRFYEQAVDFHYSMGLRLVREAP
ncbi:MAG: formylglycine-generating enzyme family protein [Candidatus Latescibacteria bacterium]|nr:formylglycine-generating enzyme family protein [Candidatus Latescibacterota bacterium]